MPVPEEQWMVNALGSLRALHSPLEIYSFLLNGHSIPTPHFSSSNFTVPILVSPDANLTRSLSYSKTLTKAQMLTLTFKDTQNLNPIYFLNFYLYSSKCMSCRKPLVSQKQPDGHLTAEQMGASLALPKATLPM